MGSQTAPKVIDDLVKKGAMEADEIVGEATKRSSVIDDIMDAELVQKANREKMDPRLAALLGGAGVGAAGVAMMGEDEPPVQPPMAKEIDIPDSEEEFPADLMDAGAQAEALSMPQPVAEVQKMPAAPKTQPESIPEIKEPSDLDMLKEAQERDQNQAMILGLLRGANQIGAGLAMTKADQSGVEALEKQVGSREKNVKSQIASKADLTKLDQMKADLEDENKLRNPTSTASILTRNVLSKYGLNIKTAKEAKDAGINVQNILLQEMANNSRESMMKLKAAEQESKELSKLDKDKQENIYKLRKELTGGNIGKQYNNAAGAARIADALQAFAENPSPFGDYSSLLASLKALQGDDSVVRGEEMKLGMNATSFVNKLQNQIDRVASGQTLQPAQRKDMIESVKRLKDASVSGYKKAIGPILENAREMGVDEKYLLPSELRDFGGGEQETQQKSGYSPKEEMGIQAVMERNGVSREQAISALKKANKLK